MMALKVRADKTAAAFDAAAPDGADIVIVPAMMNHDDPKLAAWVRKQYDKGATVVSICEGARITARAGLLDGKSATTHWSAMDELAKAYPKTKWRRDRRYIQDGRVISTAGVTASIPLSLALVEAMAGHDAALATALRVGAKDWGTAHSSADFVLSHGDLALGIWNYVAFWRHQALELPVWEGVDEIALALEADAWSRTYRTSVVSTSKSGEVRSLRGLRIVPDAQPSRGGEILPAYPGTPVAVLDGALSDIDHRFGASTVRLVRLGLEYPR